MISEAAICMGIGFFAGWFASVTSGAVFSYFVFRSRKEQHERLFPLKPRPRRSGPIHSDEFAYQKDEDDGEPSLPPIIQKMNERMGAELADAGLRKVQHG